MTGSQPFPVQHLPFDQVAAVFLIFLVLAVALLFCSFCKLSLLSKEVEALSEEDIKDFENGIQFQLADGEEDSDLCEIPLRTPYDSKYEVARNKFTYDKQKVLGQGEFAIVYQGRLGTDFDVAVKTAKEPCSAESLKSLLVEIKLLIYIGSHPNVVGIHGAHTAEMRKGAVYILSEFCSRGCLENLLRQSQIALDGSSRKSADSAEDSIPANDLPLIVKKRKETESLGELTLLNLLKWSYHIANGMEYLSSKKVVHADLATKNILVTGESIAKISHFGLSRKMYSYTKNTKENQEPGSWRWMSPETLRRLSFTTETDVWSYGVTVWEIFSMGNVPYPALSWGNEFMEQLERGLRLHKPKHSTPEIYAEMSRCWNKEPSERPKFEELTRFFGEMLIQRNPEYEKDYLRLDG